MPKSDRRKGFTLFIPENYDGNPDDFVIETTSDVVTEYKDCDILGSALLSMLSDNPKLYYTYVNEILSVRDKMLMDEVEKRPNKDLH